MQVKGPWQRLLLSAALALLPLLGQLVPLPGVEFAPGVREAGSASTTSVMALGASPLLSAYLVVELAARSPTATWKLPWDTASRRRRSDAPSGSTDSYEGVNQPHPAGAANTG